MKKSKALAITSFICSLFFWIPLLNIIFGILAIYFGLKALNNIKKEPDKYGGKAFALAGIVLGAIPVLFYLISLGICLSGYKEFCKAIGITFLQ